VYLLGHSYYGNSLFAWLVAAGVAIGVWFVLLAVRRVGRVRAERLAERVHSPLARLVSRLFGGTRGLFLLVLGLFAGSRLLEISERAGDVVHAALILVTVLQVAFWGDVLVRHLISHSIESRSEGNTTSVATVSILGFVGRVAVWSLALLLALDNLGFNISTLIAGLGIGGVAAALAAQNILGDLFASISIALDKPFAVGDFVAVGDLAGTVEYVGIRTTRVRSLGGEQLVFSNNDMLQSRIRNFTGMTERRVVFSLGVTYQTPAQALQEIPNVIREIIEAKDHVRFDRAHFARYGDFALEFEVVYYVLSADYNEYMDIQQAVNLDIYREFERRGIEFAYPTQTVFVQRDAAS
jgi:small-conductance mechanosensitive channel